MPETAQTQNFKNHTRFDPLWHFVLAPMLLINIVVAIVSTVRNYPQNFFLFFWWCVMSVVALLAVGKARAHAMVAQDRVIRLEEKLRYQSLLSPDQLARASALSVRQIIALRFASDPELPALADRAVSENLTPRQIKESITSWRPDFLRV